MAQMQGEANFKVRWVPFQLDPNAVGGAGEERFALLRRKFGPVRAMIAGQVMWAIGKWHGITMRMTSGNMGNTFDAHRLISLAGKQGKQDELVEEMFKSYFERQECCSDLSVLANVASNVGVSGAEEMLAGDGERAAVNADLNSYQRRQGIRGVPHFIIDGRYNQSGAVDSGTFQQIFQEILEGQSQTRPE